MDTTQLNDVGGVNFTPEKLAIMKLNLESNDRSRDFFSEPTTPTGARKSLDFASGAYESSSRSLARSSRHVSRTSRRASSFVSSHRSKMSKELTVQAETKFFALMELIASASQEASSLKEVWIRIAAERESFAREREEMLEEISEVSQEMERKNTEHHRHGHESFERKKQVEKLLVELSAAVATITAEKKKVTERDLELERSRRELYEARETVARTHTGYEKVRSELDVIEVTLKAAQGERDSARDEADKYQRELVKVTRERTEISSRLTDITSKFDLSRREVASMTDRLNTYDMERDEQLHEVNRLKEDAKKARLRAEEASKELIELTEKHDRVHREIHRLKETIRIIETERDDYAHTLEHHRRELKTATTGREEAEERYSDISVKYEHIKRELLGAREKLREIELERNEIRETVEQSREQCRLIVIERDELREEVSTANRRAEDARRQVVTLTETLQRTEQNLTDVRSEIYSLTERVKHVDIERDEARTKNSRLHSEIAELKERISVFEVEIRTITESRDRIRGEFEKKQREYEEITETITEYADGSGELEFEIESLRTMLREAREQKERAIAARNAADRERDSHIARYEEKCREMERFEESAASHYHAHARGEDRVSSSRIVSRSGTTVSNNHSHSVEERGQSVDN